MFIIKICCQLGCWVLYQTSANGPCPELLLVQVFEMGTFPLKITASRQCSLTLFKPAFFGSLVTRGGADLPPPSKNGCNGWEVQKLSWNLISYQDWCQTKGFTTFRYLEPHKIVVTFHGIYKNVGREANLTKFNLSWENGEHLWGQMCWTLIRTKKDKKF